MAACYERLMVESRQKSLFKIGHISTAQKLGDWYFDVSEIVSIADKGFYGPFDSVNIPMVDYDKWFRHIRGDKRTEYGIHYTPVTIAHYALGTLLMFNQEGKRDKLELFLKMANWFVKNGKNRKEFVIWEHTWSEPNYGLSPGWISAMAQGEAISVLLRAYQLTNNIKYLTIAKKALKSFKYDIPEGGIRAVGKDGIIWYEEYPSIPSNHVLNGFIFALLGVFDFYRMTMDFGAYAIWEKGILSLKANLEKYDLGYWSAYDSIEHRAVSYEYHQLHILQLKILEKLTNDKFFSEFAQKWETYCNSHYSYLRCKFDDKLSGLLRRMGLYRSRRQKYLSILRTSMGKNQSLQI